MKKLPIVAAALLFGTSAYAMVPSTEPTGVRVDKNPYTAALDEAALQPATVDWWGTAQPVAFTPAAYTADDAKADFSDDGDMIDTVDKSDAMLEDDADMAPETEPALEDAVADVEPVSYETTAVDEEPAPVENGVGGPDTVEMAAGGMTPRPAAQNYPACSPGRGDDNCIQLYEPGVRDQLATWNQPTGGLASAGETQVAMGGPYEPSDSATETERLNQQALADSSSALQGTQMAAAAEDEAALVQQAALEDDAMLDMAADEDLDDAEPVEV